MVDGGIRPSRMTMPCARTNFFFWVFPVCSRHTFQYVDDRLPVSVIQHTLSTTPRLGHYLSRKHYRVSESSVVFLD